MLLCGSLKKDKSLMKGTLELVLMIMSPDFHSQKVFKWVWNLKDVYFNNELSFLVGISSSSAIYILILISKGKEALKHS